jgi:drug/metabolite transporter (DMT)-like permease
MLKEQSQEWKGYVWALTGTIAFSSLYVFSKAGLNQIELAQFGLYYFGLGFLFNFLFLVYSGKLSEIKHISKRIVWLLVLLGITDIATNMTFFLAIQTISDPSVTSFLGNLFPIFLSVFGIIFLKERFTLIEAFGALIALIGAFVISYTGNISLGKIFIAGTGFVVINTFLAAIVSVIIKKNVQLVSPVVFNTNSNAWVFLFFLVYFLFSGQSAVIPPKVFGNITLAAFFGSFLGLLSFYYSYRFIPASRSSIIQSLKGIFVLVIAFFYFGSFPNEIQLVGGTITIIGVLIMTFAQEGLSRIRI